MVVVTKRVGVVLVLVLVGVPVGVLVGAPWGMGVVKASKVAVLQGRLEEDGFTVLESEFGGPLCRSPKEYVSGYEGFVETARSLNITTVWVYADFNAYSMEAGAYFAVETLVYVLQI